MLFKIINLTTFVYFMINANPKNSFIIYMSVICSLRRGVHRLYGRHMLWYLFSNFFFIICKVTSTRM